MAYARFSDGDVYVFYNADGYLECCGCLLGHSLWTKSVAELTDHLILHAAAGHNVDVAGIASDVREDFPSGSTEGTPEEEAP